MSSNLHTKEHKIILWLNKIGYFSYTEH